jgi:transposase
LLGNFETKGEAVMSSQNRFTDEFKRDAVAQVVDRGYPVSELAINSSTSLEYLSR